VGGDPAEGRADSPSAWCILATWIRSSVAAVPARGQDRDAIAPGLETDLGRLYVGAGMYSSVHVLPQFVETPVSERGSDSAASVTGRGTSSGSLTAAMIVIERSPGLSSGASARASH